MTRVAAVGLLTGWGEGVGALPHDAAAAAGGRSVVPIELPPISGDRFRRATRECVLGVAAVEAMLREARISRSDLAGEGTALIYATAAAYGASNRGFLASGGGTLHFPYTAPSAVPAEAAIEFALRGPYVILIGGATATVEALWQADALLARRACARALVLAVETFLECEDLYARARWVARGPLVEAAACALLVPDGEGAVRGAQTAPAALATPPSALEAAARRRGGATLACAPLVAAALARAAGNDRPTITAEWRGRRTSFAFAGDTAGAGHVAG